MSLLWQFDELLRKKYGKFVGVDEAGRGPLAGPVVAAAVLLESPIEGIDDSKKLSPGDREIFFEMIKENAVFGIGIATPEEIDIYNILGATRIAIKRALEALGFQPDAILIDGRALEINTASRCIVKGDAKSMSIAAASILAKVTRDRIMKAYSKVYKGYGFEHNFGYPTPEHKRAVKDLGPTPFHRLTFSGVIENLTDEILAKWKRAGLLSGERLKAVLKKREKMKKQLGLF